MSDQTFEALFHQYMNGGLSAEALRQFRAMAMLPENKALLSQLLQNAFTDPAFAERADYDAAEMAAEIIEKVRQQEAMNPVIHRLKAPLISRSWFKYAAAAVLFGLIFTMSWRWSSRKPGRTPVLAGQTLPSNHPVLILGDGSRISLDSAGTGTIAQQGNTQVVKLANGALAYHAAAGQDGATMFNTMQTPHGSQYHLTLPDGTEVWLNTASSIRYPAAFTADTRKVEVSGEAYFDVAKDDKKPFVVATKGMDIQVLGTAFNVMAYADEETIKTTLVQGAVKINASMLLHPGEQAVWHSVSGQLQVRQPDMAETLGWKNGEFYFRETDIRSIMREIARWYDVEVKYEGDLSSVQLSGIIARSAPIPQLLKALALTKIVRFKMQGKVITVLPYEAAN
ncbi:MAG: FecR domain-containing protein [Chitinophaga sp.]|uniref:FecR domain-containing protein n=1 Tax=Chitinophaga sp. TaxID=1869181 RepID=UPI001B2E8EFE|nr:FecR domain-containing protein [Chitinophaga sp.]MBO9732512.1 FecR domain-containing protein [Chitinophaga sp.]